MKHRIAIIGSGPAGLSAAIYTSRASIATTVYAGESPGGQLTKTTEIENYPGVMGKTGPELMMAMTEQAQKFGAKLVYETVRDLNKVRGEYDAVILAMGASPKLLGLGEEKYFGKGLSTCAVCDAPFYRGKRAIVVGGGDAAIEDALALTKFASEVTLIVRRDKLRASVIMQKRILDNPKVKIWWSSSVEKINGEEKIESVLSRGEVIATDGLFLAIGHIPATKFVEGSGVTMDENGYVIINSQITNSPILKSGTFPTMTSLEGVFAAGDCVDHRYRQAATAAGMGVSAALDCERWLNEKR